MKKTTKIWLILASVLVVSGLALSMAVLEAVQWDFSALSTQPHEESSHEICEDFSSISIEGDTVDVFFVPAPDGACRVTCLKPATEKFTASVEGDTLVIETTDERAWYHNIGIFFGETAMTVYLPHTEYGALSIEGDSSDIVIPEEFFFESINIMTDTGDVKNYASAAQTIAVQTDTGDILMEKVSAAAVDCSVSTGDITLSQVAVEKDVQMDVTTGDVNADDVTCQSLISDGNTGDMLLKNVIARERFLIGRDTGYITFDGCDAAELSVTTDTGDIKGSLLTDKVFIIRTDTGDVDVPDTVSGGKCELTTDTGDISIKLA